MASLFTHTLVGAALAQATEARWRKDWRFWCAAVVCSNLSDIDVIGFGLGIDYADAWGHRGMTHSLLFAAITGMAAAGFFVGSWVERRKHALLFFIITASHGLLDAMTDGGLGVAFFSPFHPGRYFFPWTPIEVSPLTLQQFFSERGLAVLWSEIRWIWAPAVLLGGLLRRLRGMGAQTGQVR